MQQLTPTDPDTQSLNGLDENITRLKDLFPEAFIEGKLDFDTLRELLAGEINDQPEKYGLNWNGKARARRHALTPTRATLRPDKASSVDWDTTQNLMIEGDNLEVLKLLQRSYAGKVKLIYIDPPYNTGKDFVYPDNYTDSLKNYQELTGQIEDGRRVSSNTESSGRFHTDWLNMMYPRFKLARELLSNDGVIIISLDESEISRLRIIMDEIFGESSLVANIHVQMSTVQGQKVRAAKQGNIVKNAEYLLCYSKNGNQSIGTRPLLDPSNYDPHYSLWLEDSGEVSQLSNKIVENDDLYKRLESIKLASSRDGIRRFSSSDLREAYSSLPLFREWIHINSPKIVRIHDSVEPKGLSQEQITKLDSGKWVHYASIDRDYVIYSSHGSIYQLISLQEKIAIPDTFSAKESITTIRGDWWPGYYLDMGNVSKEGGVSFPSGKKPVRLLRNIVEFTTRKDDIVLDFFAGSGTIGHAVMVQNSTDNGNRRFVLVQFPEPLDPNNSEQKAAADFCDSLKVSRNIAELTKERLRRSGAKVKAENPIFSGDTGFRVFKLDSSNITAWDETAARADLSGTLLSAEQNIKPDRSEWDVLYEVLLKLGLPLTTPIGERTIAGYTVQLVGGGALMACLSRKITAADVQELGRGMADWLLEQDAAGDSHLLFLDSAFEDDAAKLNLSTYLEQRAKTAEPKRTWVVRSI